MKHRFEINLLLIVAISIVPTVRADEKPAIPGSAEVKPANAMATKIAGGGPNRGPVDEEGGALILPGGRSGAEAVETDEEANQQLPDFNVTLLVIDKNWSDSPSAAEIEADLRAAFQDVSLPPEYRNDKLSSVVTSILFPPDEVSIYHPDHAVAFLRWLFKHGLVKTVVTGQPGLMTLRLREGAIGGARKRSPGMLDAIDRHSGIVIGTTKSDIPLIPVEVLKKQPDRVFTKYTEQACWVVRRNQRDQSKPLNLATLVSGNFEQRGAPTKSKCERHSMTVDLPVEEVAFVNAFYWKPQQVPGVRGFLKDQIGDLIQLKKGLLALLIIFRDSGSSDVLPKFCLLDRIANASTTVQNVQVTELIISEDNPDGTTRRALPGIEASEIPHLVTVPTAAEEKNSSKSSIVASPEEKLDAQLRALEKYKSERLKNSGIAAETPVFQDFPTATSLTELRQQYEAKDKQAIELAKRIQNGTNKDGENKDALRQAVSETFAVRQALHKVELAEFRKRMAEIEQTIQTREQSQGDLISRRVEDLLNPKSKPEASEADKVN